MSITADIHPSFLKLMREFALRPIRSAKEYHRAARMIDALAVREDSELDAGESDYLEMLSLLIEDYDSRHYPMPAANATPVDALRFLMEQHGMTTTGLGEVIGSKGTASDILHGRRDISKANILKLAERFSVDPGIFLSEGKASANIDRRIS